MQTTTREIAGILGSNMQTDVPVTGVSTDTRTIKEGDCFFAIKGPTFDGHDFIDMAIEKKAACVICSQPHRWERAIFVDDVTAALGRVARWYRKKLPGKVVAVTGSAGKTSTKEMAAHVLAGRFRTHRSPKSYNNIIGLPHTLLTADEGHEIIITELGTNRPGEIEMLTRIAQPDIAMVTNIHPAHLEGFGSIENIIIEKVSISRGLGPGGKFIINGNFADLVGYCRSQGLDFVTFGQGPGCVVRGVNLRCSGDSGTLEIDGVTVNVPLPGMANLENALAAWALCRELGVKAPEFAVRIESFRPVSMRMQIQHIGGLTLINDCYNANLASMANALDCLGRLAEQDPHRRKVFIAGDMAELGEFCEPLHRQLAQLAVKSGVGLVVFAGSMGETVYDEVKKLAGEEIATACFESTDALCDKLHEFVGNDDIILVKGSRSAGLEKAVEKIIELNS